LWGRDREGGNPCHTPSFVIDSDTERSRFVGQ
jgi:hypothetical protein